jgi:hypothetical protein
MVYINRKGDGQTETVDHFDTMREAKAAIIDYRAADSVGVFWISSRACKQWREDSKCLNSQ